MATVLDIGLLQSFDFIFPVIFIWTLVFAILQKYEPISKNVGINATIAAAVAFMSLLSTIIIDLINFMMPWFTVAILFFVLLLLLFRMFGAKESDIFKALHDRAVVWVLIGVMLAILFAGIGTVLGQQYTEAAFVGDDAITVEGAAGTSATPDFQENLRSIFSNSKVLGMVILFTIVVFSIALLSGRT